MQIEFQRGAFYGGGKTGEPPQPTRDGEYGNRTQVTQVGGEHISTASITQETLVAVHIVENGSNQENIVYRKNINEKPKGDK